MNYPNRIIKLGERDAAIVKAVKTQLNTLLMLPENLSLNPDNPHFGAKMKQAVLLFQARHVDNQGNPLKQDGEIGLLTWQALFGTVPVDTTTTSSPSPLLNSVIGFAKCELDKNVRETPKNSNRGTEVDAYLKRAGAGLGNAWCCAFVYWCFDEAAKQLNITNPMIRTAGCLDHWQRAGTKGIPRLSAAQARANPNLIKAGMVFIMDYGRGLGHTGIITAASDGWISTIEGNTDASKGREGGGVYQHKRKIADINKGFIDYSQY